MRDSKRYLGLELSGAKNHKTALSAIEYYIKEEKLFLLDIFERISAPEETSDASLLALIDDFRPRITKLGVNVPLALPPCIACTRRTCPTQEKCGDPAVKWMNDLVRRTSRSKTDKPRVLEFTPYTQRPIELWIRYQVLPELPDPYRFEIDETLGGNKAPLAARIHYLKRKLSDLDLVEAWPKLTVSLLALSLGLPKRIVASYRHLEQGIHAREEILDALVERRDVFIYERDIQRLANNLAAFDSFICAYTAWFSDMDQTAKIPRGFPLSTGWVHYPDLGPWTK